MKELTVEERKTIQLGILKHFDAFCNKNHIKYSIGEGSLIGAMRHHGFIPWDDDIDIIMLREEYDRFVRLYSERSDNKYPLLTMHPGCDWWECFSRLIDPSTQIYWGDQKGIHGLWVAVLPIDNFPNDDNEWIRMTKKMNWHLLLCRLKASRWDKQRSWPHEVAKLVVRILLPVNIYKHAKKRELILSKYKNEQTRRRGFMSRWQHEPWVCSSDAFDGYIEAEFEGLKVPVLKGYDEYLKCQYGNWRELPPIEKQVAAHGYKVYWK